MKAKANSMVGLVDFTVSGQICFTMKGIMEYFPLCIIYFVQLKRPTSHFLLKKERGQIEICFFKLVQFFVNLKENTSIK